MTMINQPVAKPVENEDLPAPKKPCPEFQITIDPRKVRFADDEITCDHFFRNARVKFHRQDMETLRNHIQNHGLLHTPTVRPYNTPNKEGYTHELILGSRRMRCILHFLEKNSSVYDKATGTSRPAAEIYNTVTLNCRDCDDEEAISLSLGENLEREQLDELDLMAFCKELSELKNAEGAVRFSREQISRLCNRSTSWVSLTLKLDELPNEVKDLMEARRLTRTAALNLLQTRYEKVKEVVEKAKTLLKSEAKSEETNALSEYADAISDVEAAEADASQASLENNDQALESASKRLGRARKRVRAASEKRMSAKAKGNEGQLTADHINQANLMVPGAKIGKPKPLPVRHIRESLEKYQAANQTQGNNKGIVAALEWVLGRRNTIDIMELASQVDKSETPSA